MLRVVTDDEGRAEMRGRRSMRSSWRAPGGCWPPRSRPRSTPTSPALRGRARRAGPAAGGAQRARRAAHDHHRRRARSRSTAPRVNDKRVDEATGERCRFRSSILPPWCRKSPKVAEVLPLMYLHGMSSGDFAPALDGVLRLRGRAVGVGDHPADHASGRPSSEPSPTATCRSGTTCTCGPTACTSTSASKRNGCAAWSSSVSASTAPRSWSPSPMATGSRPSRWADLLRDLKRRGMRAPVLAVGDGALGFWAALREVFPETRAQRCWVHKVANVLNGAAEVGAAAPPGGCWPRSVTPKTATTPCGQSTRSPPSSAPSGPRRSPRSSTTSSRCSPSTTSRPSTGSTSRPRTRSSRRSRRCGCAPRSPRAPARERPGWRWRSSSSRPPSNRWRAVNGPHLVALVRAGARFEKGVIVEREPAGSGSRRVINGATRSTGLDDSSNR